ncbi:hypothetical protein J2T60_001742 [Natronospira proteinivora]|uniref:O-methyltransferase n=1 Tax=Natronospira proteinivora TaxID=1807133 RepID=A0ABT1G8V5_9GAMM|nr:methyltransferase [Natronospira proteinivora]MCP1727742.1 hypothetical protein [Natronospira proteinivora]
MMPSSKGRMRAVEAKSYAQFLAFGPFAFQATVVMRDCGLLAALDQGEGGHSLASLVDDTGLSEYAVSVLLDVGRNIGLVERDDEGCFHLGRVGFFVLHDEMTRVNINFTRDVAYQALPYLEASLRESRPAGLKTLGPWKTIYEGLTQLPEPAQQSWFEFDHYYSDQVFDQLLQLVFQRPIRHLLDVGGNTGRWALKCLNHDPGIKVTLMDLPGQLKEAKKNLEAAGVGDRADYYPADLLKTDTRFPEAADTIWMSQFLDCFSEPEIVSILQRAAASMDADSRLFIVELFPDRQGFEAARFSLDVTSLYFTCLANGNSRMYHYDRFLELVKQAGLVVEKEVDLPAGGHTFLSCRRA